MAAKMTPINGRGGSRAFPTEERSKPSPQWNHYRIVCQDGAISLAVNGKVPVHFYGRCGGMVPGGAELLAEFKKVLAGGTQS